MGPRQPVSRRQRHVPDRARPPIRRLTIAALCLRTADHIVKNVALKMSGRTALETRELKLSAVPGSVSRPSHSPRCCRSPWHLRLRRAPPALRLPVKPNLPLVRRIAAAESRAVQEAATDATTTTRRLCRDMAAVMRRRRPMSSSECAGHRRRTRLSFSTSTRPRCRTGRISLPTISAFSGRPTATLQPNGAVRLQRLDRCRPEAGGHSAGTEVVQRGEGKRHRQGVLRRAPSRQSTRRRHLWNLDRAGYQGLGRS